MADNDDLTNDVEQSLESPKKKRSGFIPLLLKWIAVGLAVLIVIITVVVITVSIMSKGGKSYSEYPVSEEYRDEKELLQYYDALGQIKVHTADTIPATVIVNVALGYTNGDTNTPAELSARKIEIIDHLRSFFSRRTASELRREEKIKIEIRNEINDNILANTKIKGVRFTRYDVVEQ